MNSSQLSYQEVLQLVELINGASAFSELRIRSGDVEIDLRRNGSSSSVPTSTVVADASAKTSIEHSAVQPKPSAASDLNRQAPTPAKRDGLQVVRAPMVGTIYLAPEPRAAPFVTVGKRVAAGDQLGIIEVMKLMNPIRADAPGSVSEILVGDGETVEYGQDLFVITPG